MEDNNIAMPDLTEPVNNLVYQNEFARLQCRFHADVFYPHPRYNTVNDEI